MPTHSNKKRIPNPENNAATRDRRSSLNRSRDSLVLVTSYTKNHAVKKMPMPRSSSVRCGNTAGLIGDA